MPKLNEIKRDVRRQKILAAALACFSEDGFHQSGMAAIVQRSGLSHGAVYGYFASKDDIIEALADDRHHREAILNAGTQKAADPIEGMRQLVRAYATWLSDPAARPARRVGVHGWAEALRNERVKRRIVEGIDSPRATITGLVERAQRLGQISNELSADAIARSFIALFQGFVLQTVWETDIDVDACVAVIDRLLEGLRPSDREAGVHLDASRYNDPLLDTIDYYDRHADAFANQTAALDLEPLYQRFLRHVRPSGRILDAGCGVGRDALAFAQRGYDVVAFDAFEAMVRLAGERVGSRAVVHHMRFQDLHWQNEFHGIWTCASLLHVSQACFVDVATRLADALRPGGAWYMSFKLGGGERVVAGRLLLIITWKRWESA